MSFFLDTLRQTITRECLLSEESQLIVALSGGADSVALLRATLLLGYKVRALHCNFHLRKAESDDDELFVRSLCASYDVPCYVRHFDTLAYAEERTMSVEMVARELRYQWFQEEKGAEELIAVAHNSDDMLETFLLNLSMGTGIRGLSGMPYKRHDGVIRPMMDCSRQDVLTFLQELGQDYREDSSNASMVYKRNFIRHQLLPTFEELNPQFRANALRTIDNLRQTEAVYLQEVARWQEDLLSDKGLSLAMLRASASPRTVLFELLRPYGFNREQITTIADDLSQLRLGAKFNASDYTLVVSRDYLELIPNTQSSSSVIELDITLRGQCALGDNVLNWELLEMSDLPTLKMPKNVAVFDYDKLRSIGHRLTIRTRREGDKLKPYGMQGKKKLKKIFSDLNFSYREKGEALLLCDAKDEPLWLINHLADARFKLTKETITLIRFTYK